MKRLLRLFLLGLIHLLIGEDATSQGINLTQPSCYSAYVRKGDDLRTIRNFDLAIQQYQAAKQCRGVTKQQIANLDSLITLTKKQQIAKPKSIIRRI